MRGSSGGGSGDDEDGARQPSGNTRHSALRLKTVITETRNCSLADEVEVELLLFPAAADDGRAVTIRLQFRTEELEIPFERVITSAALGLPVAYQPYISPSAVSAHIQRNAHLEVARESDKVLFQLRVGEHTDMQSLAAARLEDLGFLEARRSDHQRKP